MEIIKTPPERFENLPGYNFEPHFQSVSNQNGDILDMHYVDEGPRDGRLILCLHGQPSWSYLYRKMIGPMAAAGFRVIAPDLIGFGRSDKPTSQDDYTYQNHVDWLQDFIEKLDLKEINLFCQDWGGLTGLRIAAMNQDRFATIIVANTLLPVGGGKMPEEWLAFKKFCTEAKKLPISRLIQGAIVSKMSAEEKAGYDAPFPDESFKAGARRFPSLVPLETDDPEALKNVAAWEELRKFEKPLLTLFSDKDPIMSKKEVIFKRAVPGAKGQPHAVIKDGGHFLQEDKGEEIAEHVINFLKGLN